MKRETDQMTDFSIFEQLRLAFHSLCFFYLPPPQTCHDNPTVKESENASKCIEVCELHFVGLVEVPQLL
jgi:hypothetical protein